MQSPHTYKDERRVESMHRGPVRPPLVGAVNMSLAEKMVNHSRLPLVQPYAIKTKDKETTYVCHPKPDLTKNEFIFFCVPLGHRLVSERVILNIQVHTVERGPAYWAEVGECLNAWVKQFGPFVSKGWRFNDVNTVIPPRTPGTIWSL